MNYSQKRVFNEHPDNRSYLISEFSELVEQGEVLKLKPEYNYHSSLPL